MRATSFRNVFIKISMLTIMILIVFSQLMSNLRQRLARKDNSHFEIRHIGFLKVHKAGSTTIQNILTRYCLSKGLTVMLPEEGNHLSINVGNPRSWKLKPLPNNHSYDVLMHHAIFSAIGYRAYLPPDSVFIASVREPFSQFISAFYYFREFFPQAQTKNITGRNPHRIYLRHPSNYDKKLSSATHNSMTKDFGFPPAFHDNMYLFHKYLTGLGKFFHLVIVVEKFDESIMLLKRLLNWPMKFFVYLRSNVHGQDRNVTVGVNDMHYHQQWSKLDYILYDFFLEKLEEKLAVQTAGFWQEVTYYKHILANVTSFCGEHHENASIVFPENEFSDEFNITRSECDIMRMKERHLLKIMTQARQENLLKYGAQTDYFRAKRMSIQWTASMQMDV